MLFSGSILLLLLGGGLLSLVLLSFEILPKDLNRCWLLLLVFDKLFLPVVLSFVLLDLYFLGFLFSKYLS